MSRLKVRMGIRIKNSVMGRTMMMMGRGCCCIDGLCWVLLIILLARASQQRRTKPRTPTSKYSHK